MKPYEIGRIGTSTRDEAAAPFWCESVVLGEPSAFESDGPCERPPGHTGEPYSPHMLPRSARCCELKRMLRWEPLNERQLQVLRAVGAGDDLSSDTRAKISVRALQGRGLLAVSTRGGWRATLTDQGRFYLAHGYHPDTPRHVRNGAAPSKTAGNDTSAKPGQRRRPPPKAAERASAARRLAARDLIAKLVESGEVVIGDPDASAVADWRKVVDFAKRHQLVPEGYRIEEQWIANGDLRITLIEGRHPNVSPPQASLSLLQVSEPTDGLHPLLLGASDLGAVFDISTQLVPRALRFLHAFLTAATARGYSLSWSNNQSEGVRVEVDELKLCLALGEELEQRDVVPTREELSDRKVYSWQRFPIETRSVPSGRLVVTLSGATRWDRRKWADRKRWTVEDKLPALLGEIDSRVQAARDRRVAAEQEQQRRRIDWEAAMDRARARYQEDRRIAALDAQLGDWEKAARIRAFCDACTHHLPDDAAGGNPEMVEEVAQWLAWCLAYADRIDPATNSGFRAPPPNEPGPEDLRPYLSHWSPYGP